MRARWRFAALLVTLLWVIGLARAASPNSSQDWASVQGVPDVLLVRRPSLVEQGLPVRGESDDTLWIAAGLNGAVAPVHPGLSGFVPRVDAVRPARLRAATARGPPSIV